MSDTADTYNAIKRIRQMEGIANRDHSEQCFHQAAALASAHGMTLRKHNEAHYSLSSRDIGWLVNLYPGNQRLFADRNRTRAPFLKVPSPWDLVDVVTAAITLKD